MGQNPSFFPVLLLFNNGFMTVRVRIKGEGLHTLAGVASCEGWGTLTLVFTPKIILLFLIIFAFLIFLAFYFCFVLIRFAICVT